MTDVIDGEWREVEERVVGLEEDEEGNPILDHEKRPPKGERKAGRPPGSKDWTPRKRRTQAEIEADAAKPKKESPFKDYPAAWQRAMEVQKKKRTRPAPWMKTAMLMHAKGIPITQIAERIDRKEAAIRECFKRFPVELEQCSMELANPEAMFMPMMPKAAAAYHEALDRPVDTAADMRVKANVAQDVFDRAFGRPVQRNINEGRQEITIVFQDSNEDPMAEKNEQDILLQLSGVD